MNWDSLGLYIVGSLTDGLTALVGCVFVAVAWATYFDGREAGQETMSTALLTFTGAVVPALLGFLSFWVLDGDRRGEVPPILLACCWLLLIGTLILSRHRTEREIGTVTAGSFVLLAIGGLGLVVLNIR